MIVEAVIRALLGAAAGGAGALAWRVAEAPGAIPVPGLDDLIGMAGNDGAVHYAALAGAILALAVSALNRAGSAPGGGRLVQAGLARAGEAAARAAPEAAAPEPPFEHVITAREGRFTYRVRAWRELEPDELRAVIWEALRTGILEEPPPGGTAELDTDIGRADPGGGS